MKHLNQILKSNNITVWNHNGINSDYVTEKFEKHTSISCTRTAFIDGCIRKFHTCRLLKNSPDEIFEYLINAGLKNISINKVITEYNCVSFAAW